MLHRCGQSPHTHPVLKRRAPVVRMSVQLRPLRKAIPEKVLLKVARDLLDQVEPTRDIGRYHRSEHRAVRGRVARVLEALPLYVRGGEEGPGEQVRGHECPHRDRCAEVALREE